MLRLWSTLTAEKRKDIFGKTNEMESFCQGFFNTFLIDINFAPLFTLCLQPDTFLIYSLYITF